MSWKKAKTLHRAFTEVSNFSYYSILWFQLSVNDKMIGWSSWSPAAMQVNGTLAVLSDKERNVELRNRSQLCQGEFSLWIVHVVETVWWLSIYDWCWDQGPQGRWGFRGQLGSVYHAPLLQTQGPSDKMSQDIPEWWAPSSGTRAGIPPEHWGTAPAGMLGFDWSIWGSG